MGIWLCSYKSIKEKEPLTIFHINGDICFTDKYDKDADICVPAAYTTKEGAIQGEYRINGVTKGTQSRKERVSIHPVKGLVISGQWHSDNGFQQHVLVKNGKVRKFKDKRKRFRRALCVDNSGSLLIIESNRKITLIEFAEMLSVHCKSAVNLDMGCYGFGRYGGRIHSGWAFYNRHKQTSWICSKPAGQSKQRIKESP